MIIEGLKDKVEYTPKFGGNRKNPESEKVVCVIRTPTVSQAQDFKSYIHSTDGTKVRIDLDAIMKCVIEVRGLTCRGESVNTGSDLMKYHELYELVDEIGGYVLTMGK